MDVTCFPTPIDGRAGRGSAGQTSSTRPPALGGIWKGQSRSQGIAWFYVSADGRYAASTVESGEQLRDRAAGQLQRVDGLGTGHRRATIRAGAASRSRPPGWRSAPTGRWSRPQRCGRERSGCTTAPTANLSPTSTRLPRPERFDGVGSTAPVAFLPDGNLVIGSMAGPLRIVNPADGTEIAPHRVAAVDDEQLLVADQGRNPCRHPGPQQLGGQLRIPRSRRSISRLGAV